MVEAADVIEAFVNGNVTGIVKYLALIAKQTQQTNDAGTVAVNGKPVAGGKINDGVMMVPARAVGEELGGKVTWDPSVRHVDINL